MLIKLWLETTTGRDHLEELSKGKAVPLHAMKAPEVRGGTAPTHSQLRL
jgi:hypothetical protein